MSFNIILSVLFYLPVASDSMKLPIHGGMILEPHTIYYFMHQTNGVMISPVNNFDVGSCSDGIVRSIWKMNNNEGYLISINSHDIIFGYGMVDTVLVKSDQIIKGAM